MAQDPLALASYYREPIKVTIAFVCLYYAFLLIQSMSKNYIFMTQKDGDKDKGEGKQSFAKIKYGSTNKIALMGDRTVGNLLEQSIPFLTALWLHAVFVDPASAAQLGWYYLGFRAIYPFVFFKGVPLLFVSTLPGYFLVWKLIYPVYTHAFNRA